MQTLHDLFRKAYPHKTAKFKLGMFDGTYHHMPVEHSENLSQTFLKHHVPYQQHLQQVAAGKGELNDVARRDHQAAQGKALRQLDVTTWAGHEAEKVGQEITVHQRRLEMIAHARKQAAKKAAPSGHMGENVFRGTVEVVESGQRARVSGAEYDFAGHNPDGTIRVRNDQGHEFSTDPGEKFELLAPRPTAQAPSHHGTEAEYLSKEHAKYHAMRHGNVAQVEHGLKAAFPVKGNLPVGISHVQWALTQNPRGKAQREAAVIHRMATRNAQIPFDVAHHKNVYKSLQQHAKVESVVDEGTPRTHWERVGPQYYPKHILDKYPTVRQGRMSDADTITQDAFNRAAAKRHHENRAANIERAQHMLKHKGLDYPKDPSVMQMDRTPEERIARAKLNLAHWQSHPKHPDANGLAVGWEVVKMQRNESRDATLSLVEASEGHVFFHDASHVSNPFHALLRKHGFGYQSSAPMLGMDYEPKTNARVVRGVEHKYTRGNPERDATVHVVSIFNPHDGLMKWRHTVYQVAHAGGQHIPRAGKEVQNKSPGSLSRHLGTSFQQGADGALPSGEGEETETGKGGLYEKMKIRRAVRQRTVESNAALRRMLLEAGYKGEPGMDRVATTWQRHAFRPGMLRKDHAKRVAKMTEVDASMEPKPVPPGRESCTTCRGRGWSGMRSSPVTCLQCKGTGHQRVFTPTWDHNCPSCGDRHGLEPGTHSGECNKCGADLNWDRQIGSMVAR